MPVSLTRALTSISALDPPTVVASNVKMNSLKDAVMSTNIDISSPVPKDTVNLASFKVDEVLKSLRAKLVIPQTALISF